MLKECLTNKNKIFLLYNIRVDNRRLIMFTTLYLILLILLKINHSIFDGPLRHSIQVELIKNYIYYCLLYNIPAILNQV